MPELAPAETSTLPAARQLAEVTEIPAGLRVRLPAPFAREAASRFLRWHRIDARLVEGPRAGDGIPPLSGDEWALLVPDGFHALLLLDGARRVAARGGTTFLCRVFPKGTLEVRRSARRSLLAALEDAKPDEVDDEGRPQPWVAPSRARAAAEHAAPESEDDVEEAGAAPAAGILADEAEEGEEAAGERELPPVRTAEIRRRFRELCAVAGIEPPPLSVRRGRVPRCGFVSGRIYLAPAGTPRAVGIATCPNADLPEVLATLVHELAHALSRERPHGAAFRASMLDLAVRAYGAAFFAAAPRNAGSSRLLDQWIASGIRAATQGREPPSPRAGDEAQLARAVRRISKLRALAADQVGQPEAIAATGQANDLVVAYALQDYDLAAGEPISDQMLDRWILLGGNAIWKRRLADVVAWWFDVLALTLRDRMHLFGAHGDLVATEYVYAACAERIERACDEHLAAWKAARRRAPGTSRRERTSFCDSAVEALREKLAAERRREFGTASRTPQPRSEGLVRAEAFARAEFDRRGLRWGTSSRRTYVANEAGAELGRSLSVARAVGGDGGPRLLDAGRG